MKRHYTLYKWILVGCIALMVPVSCAIINFFINKSLIERKINQVNHFMLENIGYNIDENLNKISNMARYHLLDNNFTLHALTVKDESRFLEQVQRCHDSMRLSGESNPNTELLLYLKNREYLLGSYTANRIDYIYGSLKAQGRIELSLEEWKTKLAANNRGGFFISSHMSYSNYGKESLIYMTPVPYSNQKDAGYLIASVSTDFLDKLMSDDTNMGNTVLILDKEGQIIGQYGAVLDLEGIGFSPKEDGENLSFFVKEQEYVGAYTDSGMADWIYVVCMPKRVFMKEVALNRNLNLLIVLIGAVFGVAAVVISQKRNYQPVRQLIDILPERDGEKDDEFKLVEKNLRKLYEENQSMLNSIESRREYDRELGLLSAMKGGNNFFRKLDTEELLGEDYRDQNFAFATIRLDGEDGSPVLGLNIDRSMTCFLLDNIMMDILGEEFRYLKTQDEAMEVYLFLIDLNKAGEWDSVCMEKFLWMNEFFQNRLESELSITVGRVFDSFEYVESAYAEISEANEQRYYTQPLGVMRTDWVSTVDFSSSGRLSYYAKRFGEVASKADFTTGWELSGELFAELEHSGKTYNATLYYILSIVNDVLMLSSSLVMDEAVREEALEQALAQMRMAESVSSLQNAFYHFLRLVCRAVGMDNQDSGRLSEDIRMYVKTHYADCNVNISAIAEEIGLTPRYMSRIFKEQTGMNLLNYINDVRIEHAKILLRTTSKTVDEIAAETGFANSRTFRRNFQKAVGVTAMNYKNI